MLAPEAPHDGTVARALGIAYGPRPMPTETTTRRFSAAFRSFTKALAASLFVVVGLTSVGCAPAVGDDCETSIDCSVNGERVCDTAQPNGYCSVLGCDPDTCPDSALCVEWRFDPRRTALAWCMKRCESDSDCRTGDGYRCLAADDALLREDEEPIARVTDLDEGSREAKFCVAIDDTL